MLFDGLFDSASNLEVAKGFLGKSVVFDVEPGNRVLVARGNADEGFEFRHFGAE